MNRLFRTIGAHWYSRKATLGECAESLLSFMLELKEHNPKLFSEWYAKDRSKKKALEHLITFDFCKIKNVLSKQGKEGSYPSTTFNTGLWNGKLNDEDMISLSVSLGGEEAKYYTNNCVLELPYEGEGFDFYRNIDSQIQLIELLIKHWSPEWIMVDEIKIQSISDLYK